MKNSVVQIGNKYTVDDHSPLTVFAGPCVIESRDLVMHVAEKAKTVADKLGINYVFKSSFVKANRSSIHAFTGPGIDEGLKQLQEIQETFNIPVVTDVHEPEDARIAGEVVDILQIPAFLCRQTNLLLAAGKTGKTVNIKKGQFLSPEAMKHAAEKITSQGNPNVFLCERGTTFGYGDLIVDQRAFKIMRELGYQVVFDCTHSVQKPGAEGSRSGGAPEFIETLARAAIATGYVNTLFMEIHPEPLKGLSDATNMMELKNFEPLLIKLKRLHELTKELNR
jgi:2-dehydro-3-deoxyphosphooctonate aldolase (KDO 8-P synthase)